MLSLTLAGYMLKKYMAYLGDLSVDFIQVERRFDMKINVPKLHECAPPPFSLLPPARPRGGHRPSEAIGWPTADGHWPQPIASSFTQAQSWPGARSPRAAARRGAAPCGVSLAGRPTCAPPPPPPLLHAGTRVHKISNTIYPGQGYYSTI